MAQRLAWIRSDDIRPYLFVRPENLHRAPGSVAPDLDWFPHDILQKNPLEMDEVSFADQILNLETKAFGPSGMAMPRWVFYDCAIVPGFVAGFAQRTETLPASLQTVLGVNRGAANEWTPLSLFIIIPTMSADRGEWVAHNLCSVNSLLPKSDQYFGIGFLSKAFGLWIANVRTCCGMTQWTSPSVRLHSHYGAFEVMTAYTPVHSYARTLTYRVQVDHSLWESFFSRGGSHKGAGPTGLVHAGFQVDPTSDQSLIEFQRRLERGEGPYFLDGQETLTKALTDPLQVYRRNGA
jgi:hypothetical protein